MNVFLILSSSAVAFYVFILLALWRDNHRPRNGRPVTYSSVDFDEVWGFETDNADLTPQSARRSAAIASQSVDLRLRWHCDSVHWNQAH